MYWSWVSRRLWPFPAMFCIYILYRYFLQSPEAHPFITTENPSDCDDLPYGTPSGVQTVDLGRNSNISVLCDIQQDGRWTVFHNRDIHIRHENFERNWTEYRNGFGVLTEAFWLGNEWMHRLTSRRGWKYELKVEMLDVEGARLYAHYDGFRVGPEWDQYRVHLGLYSGTAGDSLSYINNMMFSTMDRDNDLHPSHSCGSHDGAFWHKNCGYTYLNIRHVSNMRWLRIIGNANIFLQSARMKMRPFKRPRYWPRAG